MANPIPLSVLGELRNDIGILFVSGWTLRVARTMCLPKEAADTAQMIHVQHREARTRGSAFIKQKLFFIELAK